MEYEKLLEFLHNVYERVSKYKNEFPAIDDRGLLNKIKQESSFFEDEFSEQFEQLSPKYQEIYRNITDNVYQYKDLNTDQYLMPKSGLVESLRRIFEKTARDEYSKLSNEGFELEKDFNEFIDRINNSPSNEWNGIKFEDFNYEELKDISPEQMKKHQELWKKARDKTDEYRDIFKNLKIIKLKETFPGIEDEYPNFENDIEIYRQFENDIINNGTIDDLNRLIDIDKAIRSDPEYKKSYEEAEKLWEKYRNSVPDALRFFMKDINILEYQDNGIDFPKIEYDEKGMMKKSRENCECDTEIEMFITQIIKQEPNLLSGLGEIEYNTSNSCSYETPSFKNSRTRAA
jgi:hypothetical protein